MPLRVLGGPVPLAAKVSPPPHVGRLNFRVCRLTSTVYIPAGDYGLATWLTLKHGNAVSINIEGTIHRTG